MQACVQACVYTGSDERCGELLLRSAAGGDASVEPSLCYVESRPLQAHRMVAS